MAYLYGAEWSKDELLRRAGLTDQLGGVREVVLQDGTGRGVRCAEFETGSGLSFEVLLDRGMDIGAARFKGAALAWQSSTGPAHPAYYEKDGLSWLRTFHGGLLCTCGLTTAGAPSVDQGEPLGLHGRISHIPAANTWIDSGWRNDQCELWARGRMRQSVVFGENLTLTRRIWTHLGSSVIQVRDVVANEGHQTTPHMMLYHCNFGFPLLDKGARLVTPAKEVRPRDEVAAAGLGEQAIYEAPIDGYAEQCFYHDMVADEDGFVTALLVNGAYQDGRGLGISLRYRQAELPCFTQWKMVCAGTYVTGLEPANCWVEGRAKDRERGVLQFLEPGETREYLLEMAVLDGQAAIASAEAAMVRP